MLKVLLAINNISAEAISDKAMRNQPGTLFDSEHFDISGVNGILNEIEKGTVKVDWR